MAAATSYDRVRALVAVGILVLLGCTGNEPATADSNTNSANAASARRNHVSQEVQIWRFRPPQDLRTPPGGLIVRPVGLTQEADSDGPVFAAPRLSPSADSDGRRIEAQPSGPPQLMRLPPIDDEEGPRGDMARPVVESTKPSRSVTLPQLPAPRATGAPWLWRSTVMSDQTRAMNPGHADTGDDTIESPRTDEHHDLDLRPSELSQPHSSTDLPVRLPPLPPSTEPLERPDVVEQDSAGIDLPAPVAPQTDWPADDPLAADVVAGRSAPSLTMNDALGRARAAMNRGTELAERTALYSARAEFVQVLRLIAQAMDDRSGQLTQARALTTGLRALREVQDFAPRGMETDVDLNVGRYLPSHGTPVLKGVDPRELTALTAQQRYLAYAQQQLVLAAGDQPIASEALVELGDVSLRLYKDEIDTLGGPTAMAYYQAAVEVDPQNAKAANELGVLFAKLGKLPQARQMLLQSVSAQPTAQAWHNLFVVHGRLGETDLAERAKHESRLAQDASTRPHAPTVVESPVADGSPAVTWLESAELADDSWEAEAQAEAFPPPRISIPTVSPPTDPPQQVSRKGWKRFIPRWPTP